MFTKVVLLKMRLLNSYSRGRIKLPVIIFFFYYGFDGKTETVLVINCEKYDIKITLFRKASNIMQKETFEVCLLKKLIII